MAECRDIGETAMGACVREATGLRGAEALEVYKRNLLLVVRGAADPKGGAWMGLEELKSLFEAGEESVESTFCLESGSKAAIPRAAALLGRDAGQPPKAWYASFILQQKDQTGGVYDKALAMLPMAAPIGFLPDTTQSSALWLFFGQNAEGGGDMKGRPEHTDQISHSGTWHLQVSGTKSWTLRPNPQADGWHAVGGAPAGLDGPFKVTLQPGDIIAINTNSWFHATAIPDTTRARDQLSLSYARDFFLKGVVNRECDMTNIEGTWARKPIPAGSVVLRESPVMCVQEAGNRSAFMCCGLCVRPLMTPHQNAAQLLEDASKPGIVRSRRLPAPLEELPKLPRGEDVPDPEFGGAGRMVVGNGGEIYCSETCRSKHEASPLRVAGRPAGDPMCDFVVHILRNGHYQSFMIAARVVADALAACKDEEALAAAFAPIIAMDKGGEGGWHALVQKDEEEEEDEEGGTVGPGGELSLTVFLERDQELGLDVGADLVVKKVDAGSPGEAAGVLEGDLVVSIAGADLDPEEGVFGFAMAQMREESAQLADATMHEGFSTGWVGIELGLRRGKKRKAEHEAGGGGGGGGGGRAGKLKEVLKTGWELLVSGLAARGIGGAAERVPLATFDRIMSGVHTASWEVADVPSPLGMYIQALGAVHPPTQQRAVGVLQPLVGHVLRGGDGEDRDDEVEMTVEDLQQGWVVLPRMSAQALFRVTSTLELSSAPNCEVNLAMGEGGLEALIVAARDIAAGEPLTVAASGGPEGGGGGEGSPDGEE